MKWLLDTATLSELTRPEPFSGLLDWVEANEQESAISAITMGEMALSIERLPESKRRRVLERAFDFLRQDYRGRILDFTEGAAIEWARLVAKAQRRGHHLPVLDSQIEATAIHFGLTIVTRNEKDFFYPVFNPWQETASG